MDAHNLKEYVAQLEQVTAALAAAPDNEELRQLAASLQELIGLTEQHCQELEQEDKPSSKDGGQEASRSLDDEMALFQTEIAAVERQQQADRCEAQPAGEADQTPPGGSGANHSRQQHTAELQSSLQGLVGTRCSAPFTQAWGQLEYHAAIIEAVDDVSLEHAVSAEDVKLRVLFSHPTQRVMQPCKYYLRHTCDYEERCRFSHGHLVSVADIREYSESVADLSAGAAVLVRRDADSGLWQRAVLQTVDAGAEEATVRVTGHRQPRRLPLSELVPLPGSDTPPSDDVSSSESDEETGPADRCQAREPDPEEVEFCPRLTWDAITSTSQLGSWEKHTKGIGSRLLRQMGYVVGSGLGPQADGRVEPVEARVYPAGRSLDHCMALREGSAAGGGDCLLTVEKRLEREQKRQQKIGQRAYQRSQAQNAMFDVINRVMGATDDNEGDRSCRGRSVRAASRADLNLQDLRVGEQIREVERQVARLEAGCRRNAAGAAAADLRTRLDEHRRRLDRLRAQESSIHAEKRQRTASKRLDVF